MIRIKPDIEIQALCPKCSERAIVKDTLIKSAFTLADCSCENCGFEFYQTLKISHTIIDTLSVGKSDGKLYPNDTKITWLTEALLKACQNEKTGEVQIKKVVYKKCNQVIILNTLDFLYGHVLLKLYNSAYHLDNHENLGLIVIIPKSFEWLLPNGLAEAWIVDLGLNDFTFSHSSVQKFISGEFERFNTIYLSKAYSHPDFTSIEIARFTGIKPFDLSDFISNRPRFTFVLREDRWWFNGIIDYWLYRLCRKFGIMKIGKTVLTQRQNELVKKTIQVVLKKIPRATFYVVGLGTTGNFMGYAHDKRRKIADKLTEKRWCEIYSISHVVIGVHGSNMLLPTAHAAGCVEILPADRFGNIVQDISVRYNDRRQLYFYRFADQYAQPEIIADKLISIVENFEVFDRNMCNNIYTKEELRILSPA